MSQVNDTDAFLVNREDTSYKLQTQNLMADLQDNDLMLVNRADTLYKVTGAEIKASLKPPVEIIQPIILVPTEGDGVGGDVTYKPMTSEITLIADNGNNERLTFTDGISYNADTGADMNQPISATFTDGQYVIGDSDTNTGYPALGTVVNDAAGNTMTVLPSSGPLWAETIISADGVFDDIYIGEIAYGDGKFVTPGLLESMAWAEDNDISDWNVVKITQLGEPARFKKIAFGDGIFCALAPGTPSGASRIAVRSAYSSDLSDWYQGGIYGRDNYKAIAFGDGKFVVVGLQYGNTQALVWHIESSDIGSESWTETVPFPDDGSPIWESVAYGNGKFVAVASYTTDTKVYDKLMYADANTLQWTTVTVPDKEWFSITHGDGKFVAVCKNGGNEAVMWANDTDVTTWYNAVTPINSGWRDVTYGNGRFVAISDDGFYRIMWATDPSGPWIEETAPDNSYKYICYGNGYYLATASNSRSMFWTSDWGGDFANTMKVTNYRKVTNTGPIADDLVFTSNTPISTLYSGIKEWGNATWEVSTDSAFSSPMIATEAITPLQNQTLEPYERGDIVLSSNTPYWVRVSYNATNPELPNVTSKQVHFRTAS